MKCFGVSYATTSNMSWKSSKEIGVRDKNDSRDILTPGSRDRRVDLCEWVR